MGTTVRFLLLFMWLSGLQVCSCDTDPQDGNSHPAVSLSTELKWIIGRDFFFVR